MKILDLGCGAKTSQKTNVINIDWSIYLKIKKSIVLSFLAQYVIKGERLKRLKTLPENIIMHDLSKGIPFPSNSVDVVYHSHLFEHLDRDAAESFLVEIKRVLKPGGILRIVVPDFENLCRNYLNHIEICEINPEETYTHDAYIAAIIEQLVRKKAHGTTQQKPIIRFIENMALGDARKREETHQWMYDRVNLLELLKDSEFSAVKVESYNSSSVANWEIIRGCPR